MRNCLHGKAALLFLWCDATGSFCGMTDTHPHKSLLPLVVPQVFMDRMGYITSLNADVLRLQFSEFPVHKVKDLQNPNTNSQRTGKNFPYCFGHQECIYMRCAYAYASLIKIYSYYDPSSQQLRMTIWQRTIYAQPLSLFLAMHLQDNFSFYHSLRGFVYLGYDGNTTEK